MPSRLLAVAIDCLDVDLVAGFWCRALDSQICDRWTDAEGKGYVEIPVDSGGGDVVLLLQPVGEPKQAKNRVHVDVTPVSGTQEQEVDRLCQAGASVLDHAPGNPWMVLADPEGNEFCVLPPR